MFCVHVNKGWYYDRIKILEIKNGDQSNDNDELLFIKVKVKKIFTTLM